MKTEAINYIDCPLDSLPNANSIICKFVLVNWSDCLFIVIGPVAQYPYHANLLEQFCNEQQIPCSWADRPTMLKIRERSVQVRGGGWAEVQPTRKKIRFRGRSTAYGRFVREDLELILKQQHLCDGFSPVIES